jgi:hypothetical protein
MAVQIDWSLLKPVDFAGELQQGIEMGRSLAQRAAVEGALRDLTPEMIGGIGENPDSVPPEVMARRRKAEGVLAMYAPDRFAALERVRAQRLRTQQEVEERARRQRLGGIAVNDPQAAAREALGEGDFELAETLRKMNAPDRERVEQRVKGAAPFAYNALKLGSDEERAAYIKSPQVRQQLEASGWTPQEIEAYQGDTQTLQAVVTGASTLEQLRSQDEVKWHQVGERPSFATDARGMPIGSDNPYVQAVGGASSPSSASPAPPPVPASPGGGALSFVTPPGVTVTSGYRSPADNARVDGVPNSFHMQRGPDGQPLARDIVPGRSGMSMDALEAFARQNNPGMDVINEGDHVHLEPSPATAARLRQRGTAKPKEGRVDTDKIRSDARAAIAAGADPKKVRDRAAEMGVVL